MFIRLAALVPFVLVVLGGIGANAGEDTLCYASCPDDVTDSSDGIKVADPTSCGRYYVCSDPSGDGHYQLSNGTVDCAYGMYFNAKTSECDAIPEKPEDQECSLCDPCVVTCAAADTLLPDPYNCSGYYRCVKGQLDNPSREVCDEGLIFDFAKSKCLAEGNQTKCFEACDPCQTTCIKEGRIPNPSNCRSYHYCEPPSGLATFNCGAHYAFNPATLVCEGDQGEECEPVCRPPVVPDDPDAGAGTKFALSWVLAFCAVGYSLQENLS